MNTPIEGFKQDASFLGAVNAFLFFNRRYVLVFYSVLGFAVAFAIFVSLFSIALVLFSLVSGGGLSEEFEFTLMVLIFFGLGFQVLMAFVTIAANLWQMVAQKGETKDEFPETLKRMQVIQTYYNGIKNILVRYLTITITFLVPTIIVTLILVAPLFTMIYLITMAIEFNQAPTDIIQNIFIWDALLVGLSVLLMNYNYYLRLKGLKTESD